MRSNSGAWGSTICTDSFHLESYMYRCSCASHVFRKEHSHHQYNERRTSRDPNTFGFFFSSIQFSSVQSLSPVRLFATPWIAARQASLSITNSWSLPKLMCSRVSDAIQPSHPLLSPSPLAPNQGLFQWISSSHEVAKVLEFQLQHQSFQWTPRTDLL